MHILADLLSNITSCEQLKGDCTMVRSHPLLGVDTSTWTTRVDMDDAPPPVAMQVIGDDLSNTPGWHSHKWSGIALAPNGKLYCSPFYASKVLRVDPATDTTELIGDDLSGIPIAGTSVGTTIPYAPTQLRLARTHGTHEHETEIDFPVGGLSVPLRSHPLTSDTLFCCTLMPVRNHPGHGV